MSDYSINSLVNPSVNKELDSLLSELQKCSDVAKNINLSSQNSKDIKASVDAQAKLTKSQQDSEITLKKIEKLNQDMAIKAQKEIERQESLKVKAHQAELKRIDKESQEQRKKTAAAEKDAKKLADLQLQASSGDGSFNQLSAQYKLNTIELNKMSKVQKESTDSGKNLVSETARIRKEMNDAKKATGDYTLQVGNYEIATKAVIKNLGEMKLELKELKGMSFVGKSPEEVAALKLRIGGLMDEMGDLKSEMQVLGTEKSAVLVSGLKFIAAGVEGVVGSLNLMGVESDIVKNLSDKMTSLIAVTQSLAEIEDVVSSGKLRAIGLRIKDMAMNVIEAVQKWALTVATNAQAAAEANKTVAVASGSIATRAAAAVQWLWNSAIAANPIGAIIAGVLALTAGIYFLIKRQDESVKLTEKETEKLEKKKIKQQEAIKQQEKFKESVQSSLETGSKEIATLASLTKNSAQYKDQLKKLTIEYDGFLTATEKQIIANTSLAGTIDILTKATMRKAVSDAYTAQMSDVLKEAGRIGVDIASLQAKEAQQTETLRQTTAKIAVTTDIFEKNALKDRAKWLIDYRSQLRMQINALSGDQKNVEDTLNKIMESREAYLRNAGVTGNAPPITAKTGDAAKDALNDYLESNKKLQAEEERTIAYEKGNLLIRIEAQNKLTKLKQEAADKQAEYDKTQTGANVAKIEEQAQKDKLIIAEDGERSIFIMTNKWGEEYNKKKKERQQKRISDTEFAYKKELTQLEIAANKEYELNAVAYSSGSKSKEDYEKEKLRIATQYSSDQLKVSIKLAEDQLRLLNDSDPIKRTQEEKEKITSLLLELSKLKKEVAESDTNHEENEWDKRIEKMGQYADKAKEIFSAIGTISSAIFERQGAELDAQISANESAHQAELDAITNKYERSTKAKTAEELAKEKVDKKYAASEKKLEHDKAVLVHKQAIWKKTLDIAEATASMALAIAAANKLGPPMNVPAMIFAGIAGAAQITAIAIQDIPDVPKYKKGTDNHPGGLAYVGERGREIVEYNNNRYLANSETLLDLPKGAKVYTNYKTEQILKSENTTVADLRNLSDEQRKANKYLSILAQKDQNISIFVNNSTRDRLKYN